MPGLPVYDDNGKIERWLMVWDAYNWEPMRDENGKVLRHIRIQGMPRYPFDKLFRIAKRIEAFVDDVPKFVRAWKNGHIG